MKSVKVKTPYTPLTQQRLCCVPCAIQWILLRNKLPIFTQEQIGRALRLTVPTKYKRLFGKGIRIVSKKPSRGYGTQVTTAGPLNSFFKRHNVPMKVTRIPHSKLCDPVEIISSNLKKGNDIMLQTFMSPLDKKKQFGHALVVSEIFPGKNLKLIVGDPDFFAPKFYEVPLSKVLKGMKKEIGKRERELYIFERIKK